MVFASRLKRKGVRGESVGHTWWEARGDGITVAVRVTTGAARSQVIGVTEGRLRVRVAARPVEGQANAELVRYLAERLGVRRSAVSILRGERAREKIVHVTGITAPPGDLAG
ncbi:DUF167 domain-containing protein [Rhabdothermincola sediminis]|uniref:DUF167 domain-containing protein n=1 Tax=Rhabdothermincola sediminis TaxID=2751370 RepID=UPI0027DA4986|nr:DUF167 domain-containing protein [Rhabdothermincola sediminis]